MPRVTTAELERLAAKLGIDVIGAAPVEAYGETERHIRERRARGLFADMRFTMARPEVSCHPETLLPGARSVISAALCYYAEEGERRAGQGRLPRYTWFDAYADLREKLDELAGGSVGATEFWSTRTTMSTAREPPAPAWGGRAPRPRGPARAPAGAGRARGASRRGREGRRPAARAGKRSWKGRG